MKIDYDGLITAVSRCCLGTDECGTCAKEDCYVGYCKKNLVTALKEQDAFIADGISQLPYGDTKLYDDETVSDAIGYLLNQCKNCNLYHDEDCVINLIRSALEITLLGDSREYAGSALMYISDMKQFNESAAARVLESYQKYRTGLPS